jgi:hypothetical protein
MTLIKNVNQHKMAIFKTQQIISHDLPFITM